MGTDKMKAEVRDRNGKASKVLGDDEKVTDLVKDLAAAVSTQAQVSNQTWLGLVAVSLIALIPVRGGNQTDPREIPLLGIPIPPESFYLVVFGVVVVLTIAFAAAHAQHMRAQTLAVSVIDNLIPASGSSSRVHPKDLFDMLRQPSVNRVAPLAQLLRGKHHQFYSQRSPPRWRRRLSAGVYGLFKLASLFVYFGIPGIALGRTYLNVNVGGWAFLAVGCAAAAAFALIYVIVSDFIYSWNVAKALWSGHEAQQHAAHVNQRRR
jgi:hypothetical protein